MQRLRSRAAPLQGHAAPRASPPSARGAGWAEAGSPTNARKEFRACVCGMPPAKPHREGPEGGSVLPPEVAGAPGPGRGTPGGGGHRVALGPQASCLPRAGGSKAELAVVLGFC